VLRSLLVAVFEWAVDKAGGGAGVGPGDDAAAAAADAMDASIAKTSKKQISTYSFNWSSRDAFNGSRGESGSGSGGDGGSDSGNGDLSLDGGRQLSATQPISSEDPPGEGEPGEVLAAFCLLGGIPAALALLHPPHAPHCRLAAARLLRRVARSGGVALRCLVVRQLTHPEHNVLNPKPWALNFKT